MACDVNKRLRASQRLQVNPENAAMRQDQNEITIMIKEPRTPDVSLLAYCGRGKAVETNTFWD